MPHSLRPLLLGLLALPLLTLTPADAATRRDDRTAQGDTKGATARPAATGGGSTRQQAMPAAANAGRTEAPRRGAGLASQDRRAAVGRGGIAGWQAGLPRAAGLQRECPNGTMATLARGHDDVVRCLPL